MSERRFQRGLSDREAIEATLEEADIDNGEAVSTGEQVNAKHRKIVDAVYEVDAVAKSLTGRTPERLEEETGISKEELFPPGKDVVYIGDPWQRMGMELDNEHMFIVDYEFGESAEFISDKEAFFNQMLGNNFEPNDEYYYYPSLIEGLAQSAQRWLEQESLTEKQKQWFGDFLTLVEKANEVTRQLDPDNFNEYTQAANAWQKVREYIETTYRSEILEDEENLPASPGDPEHQYDPFANFRKEAWYTSVYAERGFRDIPDWQAKVQPILNKRRLELEAKNIPAADIEDKLALTRQTLIDQIRLKKKPEKARVVQAVFPRLPFKDQAFERFVASWSISAHLFAYLDKSELAACWEEIYRVLKKGGRAYIFPLNYEPINEEDFFDSLHEFSRKSKMNWKILDSYGQPIEKEYLDMTLVLERA